MGTSTSPSKAVQASVQTGSIPVGRHILFVRGRGVNSYEGYQSWGPVSATWLDGAALCQPYTDGDRHAAHRHAHAHHRAHQHTDKHALLGARDAERRLRDGQLHSRVEDPGHEPTPIVSTAHAHSGSYAAFLGSIPNNEPSGDSSIYQTVRCARLGWHTLVLVLSILAG